MMKKIIAGATLATIGLASNQSFAAVGDVEATANFVQAILVNNSVVMDFGSVGFTAAAPAGTDLLSLGTDANAAGGGNFTAEGGTPVAGAIDVVASAANVGVSCNAAATLENATADRIDANNIEYEMNVPGGTIFGTDTHICDGAVDTIAHGGGTEVILVGGELNGGTYTAGAYVAGVYDTTTGAGVPITFTVVYN